MLFLVRFNLDQVQHETNAFKTTFVNVKCSSSKFLEEPNNVEIEPEQKFYVNLAVYNQSKHTETLPVGVIADITPMTDEHQADFSKAASETASDMACEAVEQLEQVQLHQNLYRKVQHKQAKVCHHTLPHPFQSFNPLHGVNGVSGVKYVEHSIETGDAKPQYSTPYSHSPVQRQLIK
ncbi:Hypothetical predicted protein [Paramuricea clavata]|uniref:Uncharacterized protein n=1 Tax=Paramuricea clavata TaxID=317549 RepID=A0A7D9EKF0_PARCT|nr:Hypothetical predicted protein [Paramuricea clavata]